MTNRDALARGVQALAGGGRYSEAQVLFEQYCSALRQAAVAQPTAERERLSREWQAFFAETRQLVIARRAHAAARLAKLPRPPRFNDPLLPARTFAVIG